MKIPARTTKNGKVVPEFQVDDCFAEKVMKRTWCVNEHGYLRNCDYAGEKRKWIRLHQFVWNLSGRDKVKKIDHINGDITDNRLENLRDASCMLNSKNNRRRNLTKLGLPQGVGRNGKRFSAHIHHRDRKYHLGTFDTPKEAVAVYQDAKEILIEFAALPGYEDVLNG